MRLGNTGSLTAMLRSCAFAVFLAFAAQSLTVSATDHNSPSAAPAAAPKSTASAGVARNGTIYRPYRMEILQKGYIFIGVSSFPNGARPSSTISDPDIKYGDFEYMAIGVGRSNGRSSLGQFDWAFVLYSGTYRLGGKTYQTATFSHSWSSNPAFCNANISSNAPLAVPCSAATFKWDQTAIPGRENIAIYDVSNPNTPVLTLNGIQHIPFSEFWGVDTALYLPQLSAARLYIMGGIVPLLDGVNADGSPKIVDHVQFDSDFGGPAAFAWIDSIGGTAAANLSGWVIPVGLKMLNPTPMRIGFPYISPLQQSF